MTDTSPAGAPPRSGPPKPPDPMRRFYTQASVGPVEGGVATVLLDGRPIRTPARAVLATPPAVAERIAAEWNAQGEHVLPVTMPLTRLANTAIDGVSRAVDGVQDDIARIAGSDLVLYRADGPEKLVARQREHWDRVVRHAEARLGLRLLLAEGVMPVRQHERLAGAVRSRLPSEPLALAATHQLATLTGSAFIALAFLDQALDFDAAWRAAHVDEDWNIEAWGEDAEAKARRDLRERDARAAAFVLGGG
jgi:chaperone required for assembly of F1-ATPase